MEYNKNKGIFWILTLIIILIGCICINAINIKYNTKPNNTTTTTKKTTTKVVKVNNNKNNVIQILDTKFGKLILSKDGYVYYINNQNNEEKTLNNIGKKDIYTVIDYKSFEGYKLNINNINSLYEINNTDKNNIIMLSKDGKISNLSYDLNNKNIKIIENDSNYIDIVSVLISSNDTESYAILVDKNGNKYNYFV